MATGAMGWAKVVGWGVCVLIGVAWVIWGQGILMKLLGVAFLCSSVGSLAKRLRR